MSLTCNKNKSGSNIDRSEKPQVRFPESENFLSILTLKFLPDKCDPNHEITFPKIQCIRFFKKYFMIIVSKAFCKSVNIKGTLMQI